MKRFICALCMITCYHLTYADGASANQPILRPGPPLAPRTQTLYPYSGTDIRSRSGPTSSMDTIHNQNIGSHGDFRPQSNPIPLNSIPPTTEATE